jgi:hypothetical protein
VDEKGREVLSFIPGEAVWPAHFDLIDPRADWPVWRT